MKSELFFACKNGLVIGHNLTALEVLDIRLADLRGEVEIFKQTEEHPTPLMHVAFCQECAHIRAEEAENIKLQAKLSYNIPLELEHECTI